MTFYLTVVFTLLAPLVWNPTYNNHKHITQNYEIHGIDISHHQQKIDWEKLKEQSDFKVSFCFMKATEGGNFQDTKFKKYWEEAKNANISRGAYHFYNPKKSAWEQARNYIKTVKLAPGDLAPVLDFETDNTSISVAQMRKNIQKWLNIIEKHYGIKPIIYTNTSIYRKYFKGHFTKYHLWVADYNVYNIHQVVKSPNLKFWQFTEKGYVNGIKGKVDFNVFLGKYEEFDELKLPQEEIEIDFYVESGK
jgi:lysozyme